MAIIAVGNKVVFADNTPAPSPTPKRAWHLPDPNSTGAFTWKAGQTFDQAFAAAFPELAAMAAPADMTVTLNMDVREN